MIIKKKSCPTWSYYPGWFHPQNLTWSYYPGWSHPQNLTWSYYLGWSHPQNLTWSYYPGWSHPQNLTWSYYPGWSHPQTLPGHIIQGDLILKKFGKFENFFICDRSSFLLHRLIETHKIPEIFNIKLKRNKKINCL